MPKTHTPNHTPKPLMTSNQSQPPTQTTKTTPHKQNSTHTVPRQYQTQQKQTRKTPPKGIYQKKKFRIITKVSLFSESFYPADNPEQTKTNGEQP